LTSSPEQETTQAGDIHASDTQEPCQFVTFLVDGNAYGVDINVVREIRQWSPTTPLPNQKLEVRGVLNLRGTIVPVHDLRARFSGSQTEATENHVIVMLAVGGKTIGILVDAVSDIMGTSVDEIKAVPTERTGGDGQVIKGLVSSGNEMIALLDIGELFPAPDCPSGPH
jgi:purine-binding chemotaxis protein CheW